MKRNVFKRLVVSACLTWWRILIEASDVGPLDPGLCTTTVSCQEVKANGLTFHCRVSGPEDGTGAILLHGFPEWSMFWIDLMSYWVRKQNPLRAVACDLRGYSPGASPDDIAAYTTEEISKDVLAIADEFGFKQFHLLGHDHGAALGWYVASRNADRVLSNVAISIPHNDAWSAALMADKQTQAMFNYASHWAQGDSAWRTSLPNGLNMFQLFGKSVGYASAEEFQKALWWYNGSIGSTLAKPPVLSDAELANFVLENGMIAYTRMMLPLPEGRGVPQANPVGPVSVRSMLICPRNDAYVKCSGMDGLYEEGGEYCTGDYSYLLVDCGHNPLSVDECEPDTEVHKVFKAIDAFHAKTSDPPAKKGNKNRNRRKGGKNKNGKKNKRTQRKRKASKKRKSR